MLPARDFFEDQQADFVAGVEEVPRLRVVRSAHNVGFEFVLEDVRVAALAAAGHGLSDKGEGLMAVQTAKLDDFAVECEALVGKFGVAEADCAAVGVDYL